MRNKNKMLNKEQKKRERDFFVKALKYFLWQSDLLSILTFNLQMGKILVKTEN